MKSGKKYLVAAHIVLFFVLGSCSSDSPDKYSDIMPEQGSVPNDSKAMSPPPTESINAASSDNYNGPMGFTPWPPDLTEEAVEDVYGFIKKNANLIAHHLDGGVPWQEALDESAFSNHLQGEWSKRKRYTPPSFKVFVSITPINFVRDGLAKSWGDADNQPLTGQWKSANFSDEAVKKAYLNYAERVIEYFNPDYLAIGIESNIMITKNPALWDSYIELHKDTYAALKKKYPTLPVFATVQYEHLRGVEDESKENLRFQKPAVAQLVESSDLMALSTYRFGFVHNKYDDDYFDDALSFGKPIAIAEMGAMSSITRVFFMILPASENDQKNFVSMMLNAAAAHDFHFVVNWLAVDFDKMVSKLPDDMAEISKAWVHTGLVSSDGEEKPALSVWRNHLTNR